MTQVQFSSIPTIYLTVGLPGSGKSTWADKFAEDNFHATGHEVSILSNDDARELLFGRNYEYTEDKKWTPEHERDVKEIVKGVLQDLVSIGYSVILDNTHLNPKTLENTKKFIQEIAPSYRMEIVDFSDVPVETCIERDAAREFPVGKDVILEMAKKSGLATNTPNPYNPELEYAIICDLDGTLALFGNRRNPYDASKCLETDMPNLPVVDVLKSYCVSVMSCPAVLGKIFFFTGRQEKDRDVTTIWLKTIGFNMDVDFFQLVMRPDGDVRPDEVVKKEMYDTYIKDDYNVLFIFDDRMKVIRMWKSLGLPVFNVGDSVEF